MTYFTLLFLVFVHGQPRLIDGIFPSHSQCQDAEGELATMLEADKTVSGWVIIGEPCVSQPEAKKV